MRSLRLFLVGFVSIGLSGFAGLAACASGEPPPRHAGGPADPSAPEGPASPSPFSAGASVTGVTSVTSGTSSPMHHEGMDMSPGSKMPEEAGK